ncbi:MAG: 50S ribosomal protein L4 [Nitrospirota bacterium]
MLEVEVKDKNNNTVEKISLEETIFGNSKPSLVHEAVINYLANQRQGTHATKTRGLVRGGGKKPWRQKHTGRARAGSIRSPLWRGGGIVFGPKPRDYSYRQPKKAKRTALMAAIREKLSGGEVIVIDDFSIEKPKTKDVLTILKNLGIDGKNVLIVTPERDEKILLSAKNIPDINVARAVDLNTYDVMRHNILLLTREALTRLREIIS